jgi:hypothetical protein
MKLVPDFLVNIFKYLKNKKKLLQPPNPYNKTDIYVVRVKNSSKEIQDVVLFGGVDSYEKTNNNGCIDGCIFIDSPITNTSYKIILWSSILRPFVIGYTQVYCEEEDSINLITLNSRDAFGNYLMRTLIATPSKNQVHKSIRVFDQKFSVDAFTSLTFKIPAEQTMLFYFFEEKINFKKNEKF